MHALRCTRRCPGTLSKSTQGAYSRPTQTARRALGAGNLVTCRRQYTSEQELQQQDEDEPGTPIRKKPRSYNTFYVYNDHKTSGMSEHQELHDLFRHENRVKHANQDGPPPIHFTDIKTGMKYHAGRKLLNKEAMAELYRCFKPATGVVTPGPTDIQGPPQQVHILWRETSPPERILESIRRLVFNPCYIVTKDFIPAAVKSTDLLNVELGYASHALPSELRPMLKVFKNWKISKGGRALEKIFRFESRDMAQHFMAGLARIIKVKITKDQLVEHHPAYGVFGRRVFVRWGTEQPEEGISSWDVNCAKQTDRWSAACNVKDVLPEILDWKFETTFVDNSTVKPTEKVASQQPEAEASDNVMTIIEELMATTRDLMQAAETPSALPGTLETAARHLSETLKRVELEKSLQKAAKETTAVEAEVSAQEALQETETVQSEVSAQDIKAGEVEDWLNDVDEKKAAVEAAEEGTVVSETEAVEETPEVQAAAGIETTEQEAPKTESPSAEAATTETSSKDGSTQ